MSSIDSIVKKIKNAILAVSHRELPFGEDSALFYIVLGLAYLVGSGVVLAFAVVRGVISKELLVGAGAAPAIGLAVLAIYKLFSSFWLFLFGGLTRHGEKPVPRPALSRVRALLVREEWSEARDALDSEWSKFPGDGGLLREYERYFEKMEAPSSLATFLEDVLPQTKGSVRAYVLYRLAETNADILGNPTVALGWCRRLLDEYPSSEFAEPASLMIAKLAGKAKPST